MWPSKCTVQWAISQLRVTEYSWSADIDSQGFFLFFFPPEGLQDRLKTKTLKKKPKPTKFLFHYWESGSYLHQAIWARVILEVN